MRQILSRCYLLVFSWLTLAIPISASAFSSLEHAAIGDKASIRDGKPLLVTVGWTSPNAIGNWKRVLKFSDLVAIAGDYIFDPSILEQQDIFAQLPFWPNVARQICAMVSDIHNGKNTNGCEYDKIVEAIVKKRSRELATNNWSHFLNSETYEFTTMSSTTGQVTCQEVDRIKREKTALFPLNAEQAYVFYHCQAMRFAIEAGRDPTKTLDRAWLYEAFAMHFLTDSFSGGHLRVKRLKLKQDWNQKFPAFQLNFVNYAANLIFDYYKQYPDSLVEWKAGGKLEDIILSNLVNSGASEFGFGDYLAGAIHDRDSKYGVKVKIKDDDKDLDLRLLGDGFLEPLFGKVPDSGPYHDLRLKTYNIVTKAAKKSMEELYNIFILSKQSTSQGPAIAEPFTAQKMLPRIQPEAQQSYLLPFDILESNSASVSMLLEDTWIKDLLSEFARKQGEVLGEIAGDNKGFKEAVIYELERKPEQFITKISNYTHREPQSKDGPSTQDSPSFREAISYYNAIVKNKSSVIDLTQKEEMALSHLTEAEKKDFLTLSPRQRSRLSSLSYQQRYKLIKGILSGWGENVIKTTMVHHSGVEPIFEPEFQHIDPSVAAIVVINLLSTANPTEQSTLLHTFNWLDFWIKSYHVSPSALIIYEETLKEYIAALSIKEKAELLIISMAIENAYIPLPELRSGYKKAAALIGTFKYNGIDCKEFKNSGIPMSRLPTCTFGSNN